MILFVSDLDGTLLNDVESLDDEAAERIGRLIERGVQFTVATARAYPSIKAILHKLPLRLPIIEQNGAIIRDFQTGEILERVSLGDETVEGIFSVFERHDLDPIVSVLEDELNPYFHRRLDNDGMNWFVDEKGEKGRQVLRSVSDYSACQALSVLSFTYLGTETRVQALANELSEFCAEVSLIQYRNHYTGEWEINVNAPAANKGTALESLRRRMGGVKEVVAFGDNYNDVSMLQAADVAVTVANAPLDIQSLCHHVTHRNSENGVVRFIEDYLARL